MSEAARSGRHATGWRLLRHRLGSRISDLQLLLYPVLRVACLGWCWLMHHNVRTERRGPLFGYIARGEPCIVTFWHEDAFPLLFELIRYTRGFPAFLMLSRGRVGGIARYLLRIWGLCFVHGSDRHRGKQALEALVEQTRANPGWSILLTADGSRGPARVARWGAVRLARETGLPIVGARMWGDNLKLFRHRNLSVAVPGPWGRAVALSAEPLHVPADADEEALERYRAELEGRLRDLAEASCAYFSEGPQAVERFGPPVGSLPAAERRRRQLEPVAHPSLAHR